MSISMNKMVENILSNNIEREEAIHSFEKMSDEEKTRLVFNLKNKLSEEGEVFEAIPKLQNGKNKLRALNQRNMNVGHREFIKKIITAYNKFVPKSKKNIAKHQSYFVDQRRPFHLIKDLKELHYQITYKRAEGAYVYDIDDNKYIDIAGDMGVNLFGHKPNFITKAIKDSLDQGIPLAGYSETIFKTAKLFSEITGHERVLFTQSGTEAVMWAVRIARAATHKKKIVIFDGAYHGLSDAVTGFKDEEGASHSAGPGMLQEFADQLLILDYGDMQSLDIIEEHAEEIACVLVEPVQSRHPYNQPIEFLKEIRKLTIETDIPLIFDEMITGFRVCPKGAQGYFNIKADIATYGKIPGGGLPTGMIAGSAKYMDIIDGGKWNFGDNSMPKSKRTLMAGTHSQNPLKIAATYATLKEIKKRSSGELNCDNCSCFQKALNSKTESMANELNVFFDDKHLPISVDYFGSLFRFRFVDSYWGVTEALFFILLRMNGVETNIQGNCFLTSSHTDKDVALIIDAVKESIVTLLDNNYFSFENNEEFDSEEYIADEEDQNNEFGDSKSNGHVNDEQLERLKKLIIADIKNC